MDEKYIEVIKKLKKCMNYLKTYAPKIYYIIKFFPMSTIYGSNRGENEKFFKVLRKTGE